MSEMNSMMAQELCEMEKEKNWQENIRWMIDDVRASINGRKNGNIGRREAYMGLMTREHRWRR